MQRYFRDLNLRITQVQMLHVGLGDGWRLVDVVYVLTGRICS